MQRSLISPNGMSAGETTSGGTQGEGEHNNNLTTTPNLNSSTLTSTTTTTTTSPTVAASIQNNAAPASEGLAQTLLLEVLARSPRPLVQIQAELLFIEGQYLLHWRDPEDKYGTGSGGGGAEHFKFLAAEHLRRAFSFQPVDSQWLLPGTLRWGTGAQGSWMVRLLKAANYNLELEVSRHRETGEVTIDLSLPSNVAGCYWERTRATFTVPLPLLVFGGVGNSYYLWAVKKINWQAASTFPNATASCSSRGGNPNAVLYHAPLPNVGSSGLLCYGSNQPPTMGAGDDGNTAGQILEQAWQTFIQSPFNDHLKQGKSKFSPADVRIQLIKLATTTTTTTPTSEPIQGVGQGPTENTKGQYPLADLIALDANYYVRGGTRCKKTLADAVEEHFAQKGGL